LSESDPAEAMRRSVSDKVCDKVYDEVSEQKLCVCPALPGIKPANGAPDLVLWAPS